MDRPADIPSHICMCHCIACTAYPEAQAEEFRDGHDRRKSIGDTQECTCSGNIIRKQETGMEPQRDGSGCGTVDGHTQAETIFP